MATRHASDPEGPSFWLAGLVLLGAQLAGCAAAPLSSVSSNALAAEPEASHVDSKAAGARAGLLSLEVPGFLPAVLFVPAGLAPAPLLVAAHGAGGDPDWDCEYWRRLTKEQAFVLCLRGKSMGSAGGYYYPEHYSLEAELVAAKRAARAAAPRIEANGAVYAGFSQGASMGSAMLAAHGAELPYLILVEGFERWNIPRAKKFAQGGGKRVLFVCGTKQCSSVAAESLRWLTAAGVEARHEAAPGAGHTPLGEVATRIAAALPWLVRDETAWTD